MRKFSIRVILLIGLSTLSSVAMAASSIGNWNVYYGHLHNHSTVSDGSGSLDQAYSYARDVAGLDFFSTGDHAEQISSSEWNNTKNVANSYNQDGVFTTFYAFEWSSGSHGHVLVVNSDDYCSSSQSATNTFSELLTWLSSRETVAFFNHPGRESNAFNHFDGTVSDKFVGMELWNKTDDFSRYYYNDGFHSNDGGMGYFDEALLRGWKIGASGAEDNHGTNWGTRVPFRKAILANSLTRADLYTAMKERRFFSTLDKNIGLLFEMDSQPMGSTVNGGTNNIVIQANDVDYEIVDRVELLKNGVVINTWYPNTSEVNITDAVNSADGDYFYVRIRQTDGDEAISSPIFISGGSGNVSPIWSSNPVTETSAIEESAYSSTLADDADDAESDPLTFAKISGPAWLYVAADGSLSGTPLSSDVGANSWIVSVSDGINAPVQATLNITVNNSSGGSPVTVTSRVNHGDDDVEEKVSDGSMYLTSSDIELVYDGYVGGNQLVGIRFNNVDVPQGMQIQSASIQFTVDEVDSGTTSLVISGEDSNDAERFTSTAYNVSSRPKTSASVNWSPAAWNSVGAAGNDQKTPNLAAIVQEIVGRSGWSQGNSMAFFVDGSGERTAESYNGSSSKAALLSITYLTPGSGGNDDPVADAGPNQTVTDTDTSGSETVILDGSASYDPDGSIVAYTWKEGTTTIATGVTPSVDLSVGVHTIVLTVEDNDGATDTDTVVITVEEGVVINQDPIADAGSDQTLTDNDLSGSEQVQLDGTGSYDPDGSIFTYTWKEGSTTIATGATPAVYLDVGTHTIVLTVTDNYGATSDDTVVITINAGSGGGDPVTVTSRVNHGDDDVEQYNSGGSMYMNSSDLELVYDGSTRGNQHIGIRFNGIDVPQGAQIQSATIQFTVDETNSGSTSLTIRGEDTNNASRFTTSSYNVTSRPDTSASVNWYPPAWNSVGAAGADQRTPDLAAIVQEIVNRSGWSQGNSMAFFISGSGERTAESYNGSSSKAALLSITYLDDGSTPPPNEDPVADAGNNQTIIDDNNNGSETVTLNGSGSYDPDGSIASYTWKEGSTTIASGSTPSVSLSVGTHTIVLNVTDNDGATDTDTVVVTVEAGQSSQPVTISRRVSTGNDDAEQYQSGGRMYLNSSDLELVKDGSKGNQYVGIRFRNMTIPQDATITNAYIQFTVDEKNSGSTSLTIKGHDTNNAGGFTTTKYNISDRTTTSASVNWNPAPWTSVGAAGADQRTPNLATVVQEIVNRSGWSSGNSIVMIITGAGERTAESYNGSSSKAPKLVVTYE